MNIPLFGDFSLSITTRSFPHSSKWGNAIFPINTIFPLCSTNLRNSYHILQVNVRQLTDDVQTEIYITHNLNEYSHSVAFISNSRCSDHFNGMYGILYNLKNMYVYVGELNAPWFALY